jgi:hypothetical protein
MKLRTKIILTAFSLTLLAFGTGIKFSAWESGHGTSAWLWMPPLAALAWTFTMLAMLVWNAK